MDLWFKIKYSRIIKDIGFALAVGVLLWLGWLLVNADSSLRLRVCAKSTCQEAEPAAFVVVRPEMVLALVEVPGCVRCTQLVGKEGRELIVVGTPDTIACQIFGGEKCQKPAP